MGKVHKAQGVMYPMGLPRAIKGKHHPDKESGWGKQQTKG